MALLECYCQLCVEAPKEGSTATIDNLVSFMGGVRLTRLDNGSIHVEIQGVDMGTARLEPISLIENHQEYLMQPMHNMLKL